MEALRWELPGKRTFPLEYKNNTYQISLEDRTVQVYENGQLIVEENLHDEEWAKHQDSSLSFDEQLLHWADTVLKTFIQACGVCGQEKMSFPLALTALSDRSGSLQQKGITAVCPDCILALQKETEKESQNLKLAFLQGDLSIYGGSEEELQRLVESWEGLVFQQYVKTLDSSWTLGMMRFSPHRSYLVALKTRANREIETFLLLAKDKKGHITSLQPEAGLEILGFQLGDQIEFIVFQI